MFDNLKPKPIEKPNNEIEVPDHLEPVETTSKPLIGLNLSDRWNQLFAWTRSNVLEAVAKIIEGAIPIWAWILFAVVLALLFRYA